MTSREPAWRRYRRFWGSRVDADIDDELAFHVDMRTDDYLARGLDPTDARAAALTRLGDLRDARAACATIGHRRQRRMTRTHLVDAFRQDLRYAARTLGRQRGWTAVALLTLALGIGASTTMFSVVNSLVLHPLPYAHADRVFLVWRQNKQMRVSMSPSREVIADIEKSAHGLEGIEPYWSDDVTLTGRGETRRISAAAVRGSFARFTGMPLELGRSFLPEESTPGGARVAMIGEALWRESFGARASALGERLVIDDIPYTIVGVTPKDMRLPSLQGGRVDVWLPLVPDTSHFFYQTVARVRPNVPLEAIVQELDSIAARSTDPRSASTRSFTIALMRPDAFLGFKTSLFLLSGAVVLLLVVACANVAHLLIARGATRRREMAIRAALGAGRSRLLRQVLTESFVLAALGCLLGIGFAFAGVKGLVLLRPAQLSELALTTVDRLVMFAAVGISLVTGLAFGLTAAFYSVRRTTADALRATSSSGTGEPATHRFRSLLVVTEMTLSAMLLVGAALLTRSISKLEGVDPGFNTEGLYSLSVALPASRYSADARGAFIQQTLESVRKAGGVTSVAVATSTPPNAGFLISQMQVEGIDYGQKAGPIAMNSVMSEYFATVGLRLVGGSTFSPGAAARNDIIVNEGFAKKLWPGESAIGHRIRFADNPSANDPWHTIVGVVTDMPVNALKADRSQPLLYFPYDAREYASEHHTMTLAIRTAAGVDAVSMIRQIVASIDPRLPPAKVKSVSAALEETFATQRFTMRLLATFAALAVLLSGIGLYGVISYVVTQRQREIGIRIALGATPGDVAGAVVWKGLALSTIGLAVGLAIATQASKVLQSSLYGVTGTDAWSYFGAGLLLLAVSLLACIVPMRRAMSVDPAIAMRAE